MATISKNVGIKVSGIDAIISSITDYANNLNRDAATSINVDNVTNYIKGVNTEAAIRKMAIGIENDFAYLMKDLARFCDLLETVKANYETHDTSNTSFNRFASDATGNGGPEETVEPEETGPVNFDPLP